MSSIAPRSPSAGLPRGKRSTPTALGLPTMARATISSRPARPGSLGWGRARSLVGGASAASGKLKTEGNQVNGLSRNGGQDRTQTAQFVGVGTALVEGGIGQRFRERPLRSEPQHGVDLKAERGLALVDQPICHRFGGEPGARNGRDRRMWPVRRRRRPPW